MIIIYYTIGFIVIFAIILAVIQTNDEKMFSSILRKIEKRRHEHTDFFSILNFDYDEFKSFTYKKAIIIAGFFYVINIINLFETKKYEITSDGYLFRTVATYWGFKKQEYLLESRDGRWYGLRAKDGKYSFKDNNWFEIYEDDDIFFDIEEVEEPKEWFE